MESIRVVVRVRPDNSDIDSNSNPNPINDGINTQTRLDPSSCVRYDDHSIVIMNKSNPRAETSEFHFDRIFPTESTQEEIFEYSKDLVDSSLAGYNATIFAFGMTGSGKTHTISGTSLSSPGIVPRTIQHVFSSLRQRSKDSRSYVSMVFLSYIELYNNILYDLLATDQSMTASSNLRIHDHPTHGITITGSPTIRIPVTSVEETLGLIGRGTKYRATASTNLNERSSRSHTIITLEIVRQVIVDITNSENSTTVPQELTSVGKINLVDLAGSERVKMSGAEGQALEEAKQINKALTVLGDVLNSLSKYESDKIKYENKEKDRDIHSSSSSSSTSIISQSQSLLQSTTKKIQPPHVPYRNSKLTMLLKDSLGGNSKSMMIATIRQSASFYQQTMITLRYASRAKLIQCNPMQNIQSQDSTEAKMLRLAVSEVSRLKETLSKRTEEYNDMKVRLQELEKQKQELVWKQSSVKQNTLSIDQSVIEAKEREYRQQLEELQYKAIAEQQHLQNHMKGIIHQHQNILSERENDVVILELRLAEQLNHIESLSHDRNIAIEDKKFMESNNKELMKQIVTLKAEVMRLHQEKSRLQGELTIATDAVAHARITVEQATLTTKDKEIFTEALQKLTNSRAKYKKRTEDLEISYNESLQTNQELINTITSLQKSIQQSEDIITMKDEEMKTIKEKIREEMKEEMNVMKEKMIGQNQLMHDAASTIKKLEKKIISQKKKLDSYRIQSENNLSQSSHQSVTSLHPSIDDDHDIDKGSDGITLKSELKLMSLASIEENNDENNEENHMDLNRTNSEYLLVMKEDRIRTLIEERDTAIQLNESYKYEIDSLNTKYDILQSEKLLLVSEWQETLYELNERLKQQIMESQENVDKVRQEYDEKLVEVEKDTIEKSKSEYEAHYKDYYGIYYKDYYETYYKDFYESKYQDILLKQKSDHEAIQSSLEYQIYDLTEKCSQLIKQSSHTLVDIQTQTDIQGWKGMEQLTIKHNEKDELFHNVNNDQENKDNGYDDDDDDNDNIETFYDSFDISAPIVIPCNQNINPNQVYDSNRSPDWNRNKDSSSSMTMDSITYEVLTTLNSSDHESNRNDEMKEMDMTPRKENIRLKDKINQLQENDKDMLMILEKRLVELNEARIKLLKLNNYIYTRTESDLMMSPKKDYLQLRLAEERINQLEQDIQHEKVTNASLQSKLHQHVRITNLQENKIARLEEQLDMETKNRRLEIEKAVKVATRFVIDNQVRRSMDLEMLDSISMMSDAHTPNTDTQPDLNNIDTDTNDKNTNDKDTNYNYDDDDDGDDDGNKLKSTPITDRS